MQVPFGYDESITLVDFNYLLPILVGVLIFNFAYILTFRKLQAVLNPKLDIKYGNLKWRFSFKIKKKHLILIVIQVLLLIYWSSKIFLNYTNQQNNDSVVIFRVLVGKESFFLLFLQSVLPVVAYGITRSYLLLTSLFVALLFAWFDGTRSALLPLSLVMLSSFNIRNKTKLFSITTLQIYIYIFSAHSRYINDKLNLDNLTNTIIDSFVQGVDGVFGLLGYVFGYSLLHYIATTKNELGQFQLLDLVYSLTPLPSKLIPINIDTSLWRVDQYRPMGAIAELSRVSNLFTYIFFFILGGLAKRLDGMSNDYIKSLSLPVFFLICVSMFQYHLRALQWFIILQFSFILLDNMFNKYHKKHTNGGLCNIK
jgi:hypothetical protein